MAATRQVLRTITLSVVVMHAAALVLIDTSTPKAVQPGKSGTRHRVIQTRLALATPTLAPSGQAAPATTSSLSAETTEPSAPPAPVPLASADTAPAPEVDHTADAPATQAPPAEPPAQDTGDTYLPRPMLTAAPQPSEPVLMDFPKQVTESGRYATILALFIDEDGVVRRVRVDGPALPKPMEDTAKATFLQTRFRPGEVNGQQVKSLIRIEVVFDNTPTDDARQASRSL